MQNPEQLHIEEPVRDKAVIWAELPGMRTGWLREIAPELGLESRLLVISEVITSILGDDYSPLGHEQNVVGNPEIATLSKNMLLSRLRWELSVPELPKKLKDMIALCIKHIERYDFARPKQFRNARSTWILFREEVQKLVEQSEPLTAAVQYHHNHRSVVNERWEMMRSEREENK